MTRESGSWEGRIESLSHEGLGTGIVLTKAKDKVFRRPIFVPFTVPGDVIVADVKEQKRKYMFGEISAVMKESPARRVPKCPHFMTCGGCNLQHVSYAVQLEQKAKQVTFLLQRKGIQLPYEIKVLPSKERHHYRWRARIAVAFKGTGCTAGFRKHRSRDIVPIQRCFVVHKRIMEAIVLFNAAGTGLNNIEVEVTVVVGTKGKLGLLIPVDDIPLEKRQEVKLFFEDIYARNRQLIGNVFFSEDGKTRSYGQVQEHFTYDAAGMTFSFLPDTFIQSNISTDTVLIETCLAFLFKDVNPDQETVLDLYAGMGNLSLPIAKKAKSVFAVEGAEGSVLAGTTNAIRNGVKNSTFFHHSVERYMREFTKHYKRGDYTTVYPKATRIVVDPPRTGLTPSVTKELLALSLPLLYVSCNPTTLAHDLHELQKKYVVKSISCIDMFPDTNHVETVVFLEKR